MPIGYLITVVIPAAATAVLLAPVPRGWTLGQICWRLSLQLNELPALVAAWVVAATVLAGAQGDLFTPGGVVGLSAAALTLAGLAVVLSLALRACPAAARALCEGLGPGWRAALPQEARARLARRRPWPRLLFAPFTVRRRDVVWRADLAYGPAGRENLLDVYLPRSGAVTGPCLVYFHGGGYRSGRPPPPGRRCSRRGAVGPARHHHRHRCRLGPRSGR